jgi:Fic family protein
MFKTGLIQSPMFYISAFFEANRDEYYDKLLAISRNGAWNEWCKFFLEAVANQAQENQSKATKILDLYERKKKHIVELTRSQ